MLFSAVQREREPARWENPREPPLRPELIPQGAKKERGYRVGRKSSERRFNAGKVLKGSAGTKQEKGNFFLDPPVEESSEGRIPGAWGAERGFLGIGDARPREGSQTLRRELLKDRPTSFRRSKE